MSYDSLRGQLRPIANIAGLILVIVAGLKLAGMHFGVPGSIADDALVGIGLLHV